MFAKSEYHATNMVREKEAGRGCHEAGQTSQTRNIRELEIFTPNGCNPLKNVDSKK
jgi:hypothetical protein